MTQAQARLIRDAESWHATYGLMDHLDAMRRFFDNGLSIDQVGFMLRGGYDQSVLRAFAAEAAERSATQQVSAMATIR